MVSVSFRRRKPSQVIDPVVHVPNFEVQEVDNVRKFIEVEPVALSLAQSFSVEMNALTSRSSKIGSRVNCDIVDIEDKIDNLVE